MQKKETLMHANDILDDQVILKKGRLNGVELEPAYNSYFDFYISTKYVTPQLIRLEDAMFHLFLRKNLNIHNPNWKMPSIRQMMCRLSIGQKKIEGVMFNLERAHLLTKESGFRKGERGLNLQNTYVLSDPLQTLSEFIAVAQEGLFPYPLREEWRTKDTCMPEAYTLPSDNDTCMPEAYTRVVVAHTPPVCLAHIHKQTPFKQTSEKQSFDPAFAELRSSMPEKTFDQFLTGARFLGVEEGVAVIGLLNGYAKGWIENRMANRIKQVFKAEAVRCVILTEIAWSPPGGGLVAQTLI
jgi:hypothetical protein